MQQIDTKNSLVRWSGVELQVRVKKEEEEEEKRENATFNTIGFGM